MTMKKILQGQSKLINIMRRIFYISGKVTENFDASIIGPHLYVVRLTSAR